MSRFYEFGDNTFGAAEMPWIQSILKGLDELPKCQACGGGRSLPRGDLLVEMEKKKARLWPDVVGCGAYPALVVSEKLFLACRDFNIELAVGGNVRISEPLRNGLPIETAPQYVWIDGIRHFGAKVNFEASGYVDVRFCSECGRRMDNVSETYKRQHSAPPPPTVFVEGTYTGLDLFTTDVSPTLFFCTQKLVDCISQRRLINCRFVPIEKGPGGQPIDYLASS